MKKLFTSCYSKAAKLPEKSVQIRTSHGLPHWWRPDRVQTERELFPKGFRSPDWRNLYQKQLEEMHESGELQRMIDRTEEGSVFMCFEAKQCDCHRGILAEFLNEKGLAKVSEWGVVKGHKQMSLL